MPRSKQDVDFDIHVDQSCLSETQNDSIMSQRESLASAKDGEELGDMNEILESQIRQHLEGVPDTVQAKQDPQEDRSREEVLNSSRRGWRDLQEEEEEEDQEEEAAPTADASLLSFDPDASALSAQDEASTLSAGPEDSVLSVENERQPAEQSMVSMSESELVMDSIEDSGYAYDDHNADIENSMRSSYSDDRLEDSLQTSEPRSRRDSAVSTASLPHRRSSGRTEALIQAAARDIVAQIETNQMRESIQSIATTVPDDTEPVLFESVEDEPTETSLVMDDDDQPTEHDRYDDQPEDASKDVEDNTFADVPAAEEDAPDNVDGTEDTSQDDSGHTETVEPTNVSDTEVEKVVHHDDQGKEQLPQVAPDVEQAVPDMKEAVPNVEESMLDIEHSTADVQPERHMAQAGEEAHEQAEGEVQEQVDEHVDERAFDQHDAEDLDNKSAVDMEDTNYELERNEEDAAAEPSDHSRSARISDPHNHLSKRNSGSSQTDDEHDSVQSPNVPGDGFASGSSLHGEDDVFSDHSPRSSVGCPSDMEYRKMTNNVTRRSRTRSQPRSPRLSSVSAVSGVTGISGYSRYDDRQDEDDFVPTARGTPRPPFRSPSSVKAMQMTSPAPSVFGSPSSRRRGGTPQPRLGSPGISAQYSPKKTPPRFKRNTPPLVLLHVTLLPLRWAWGDVLNNTRHDELSREGKGLREAWRQLQDRMGDTTCERGILLPHPQNDYEVLEERLLEALELPVRRRARILECGHYLGPANESTLLEDDNSSEEEYDEDMNPIPQHDERRKVHWCATCRSDIRYDSLGAGKVFRVKVYASNGLMKAGAWDTCWKEMERVDVELEPLVDASLQDELARLEAKQHDQGMQMEAYVPPEEDEEDEDASCMPEEPLAAALPVVEAETPTATLDTERRARDEERLREIYGHAPRSVAEPEAVAAAPSPVVAEQYAQSTHTPEQVYTEPKYTPYPASTFPAPEDYEQERERVRQDAFRSASLPELLLQSFRVLMADRKNVVILVMGMLVATLALKPAEQSAGGRVEFVKKQDAYVETAPAMQLHEAPTYQSQTEEPVSPSSAQNEEMIHLSVQTEEASPSIEIIRVVETVRETVQQTVTATVTKDAQTTGESSEIEHEGEFMETQPSAPVEDNPVDETTDLTEDGEAQFEEYAVSPGSVDDQYETAIVVESEMSMPSPEASASTYEEADQLAEGRVDLETADLIDDEPEYSNENVSEGKTDDTSVEEKEL